MPPIISAYYSDVAAQDLKLIIQGLSGSNRQ